MRTSRHVATGAVALAASLAVALTGTSALGDIKVRANRLHDAPRGYDIGRTAFHNGDVDVSVRVRVRGLARERTVVDFVFGLVRDPDTAFHARTYLRADGTVRTPERLHVFREGPPINIPCDVDAHWLLAADRVEITVPRSCVDGLDGRLAMLVASGKRADPAAALDRSPTTRVSQG